jgi:nucleoside-diphosphate-sugar epimerase
MRHRPGRVTTRKTGKSYLVVGGHGMLGSHMVEGLLARGEERVALLDMRPSPLFAGERAVTVHTGDIADLGTVERACRGVDTVFHTAAAVNYWARRPFEYEPIHRVNVAGTQNVVAGCLSQGVQQLLHTSSTSVVVGHDIERRPLRYADETAPYAAEPYLCHYIRTKVLAEQAVLAADGRLLTAALRPGGMFGPRELTIVPAVRAGFPGIGGNQNAIDHIYVENVVHAFLLLEARLSPDSPARGQAYFITNYDGGAETYFDFNSRFSLAYGRRFRLAPAPLISALAWASETLTRASRGKLKLGELAKLRPATVALSRGTYYFSDAKARRDFGYRPLYTIDEGIDITVRSTG